MQVKIIYLNSSKKEYTGINRIKMVERILVYKWAKGLNHGAS